MNKARRWLLWGLLLSPVAILPTGFVIARVWLHNQLQRELAVGDFRLRLFNPYLSWNLSFSSDSFEVTSPAYSVRAAEVDADLRIWNSIASLKPSLRIRVESVLFDLEPDTSDDSAKALRRRLRKPPSIPNVRIPLDFRLSIAQFEAARDGKPMGRVDGLEIRSQGPKGVVLEAKGFAFAGERGTDPPTLEAAFRASARWFGKSLRYQVRLESMDGDYLSVNGARRKTDLRIGGDSLEIRLADLTAYAAFFPGKVAPAVTDLKASATLATGGRFSLNSRAAFSAPPIWKLGPQRIEWSGSMQDSAGRLVLTGKGDQGESVYLQGHFSLPSLDSLDMRRLAAGMTGTFSGYTRNFRFPIGRRILPGDAEIRRIRILPGLNLEAELRTRDSSVMTAKAFRAPHPGPSGTVGRGTADSAWKCAFAGTIDPRETWVHAWVDTHVVYRSARIKGEVGPEGLRAEAWFSQPRAYGAAGDSLYTEQRVTRTGYYLTASRLYAKETMWPVTGRVEWTKGEKRKRTPDRKRVRLSFATKHPRYGSVEYSMPMKRSMAVRAESLDVRHLPYTRLARFASVLPVVTGDFQWDWLARTGYADIRSTAAYRGEGLGIDVKARWDAALFQARGFDVTFAGSVLHLSGSARLRGRQFWEMRKLVLKDIQGLALEAEHFDASRLSVFLGGKYPVERGILNGKFGFSDTAGFTGTYEVTQLDLGPLRKLVAINRLSLIGRGDSLLLAMRTVSAAHPWFNDSITLTVSDVLGRDPGLSLRAVSDDGLRLHFKGAAREFRNLEGAFTLEGKASLPGQAGQIRNLRAGGRIAVPFSKGILSGMTLDSGAFQGRYAVPGLDTQSFSGTVTLREGRMRVPDLRSVNKSGLTLSGEAEFGLGEPRTLMATLRGDNLSLQWPGIQKLVLQDAQAEVRLDGSGLTAKARVGRTEFVSVRSPINIRGTLENASLAYFRPSSPGGSGSSPASEVRIPRLEAKAKMRNFLFKHKIGFRQIQRSIRTVKTDKRKKRVKPMDLHLSIETAGAENRIETDVLRMVFLGDMSVKGVYPYTLLTGEFSSLSGELGQTSQSYDINDFDLKWQNATVEEGRISVEGSKRLASDCKPDTKRTCNVYVKLSGRLDDMAFTYDSDCGGNTGETIEPTALINSVSRGCYSDEYVAGAGGGNYGEAVFTMLEPTINEKLSSVGNRFSGGWIKSTQVSGIGTMVSGDTISAEPIAIGVESKEKWGVSFKAKAGYHPEKKESNTWENKISMEWRPPLEKVATTSAWKRRVRDRVTLEASAETRPEEKVNEENKQARKQVGIRYRYKFWNLW